MVRNVPRLIDPRRQVQAGGVWPALHSALLVVGRFNPFIASPIYLRIYAAALNLRVNRAILNPRV